MTLHEYITSNLRKPFEWGQHDCVLFAIGWLNQATGKDWLEEFPKWATAKEALRSVESLGGLKAAADARLKPIHPNLARDGDIALYDGCLCLFSGAHVVGPGPSGLTFVDRTRAECAWSY
jgi:hypothetical protein